MNQKKLFVIHHIEGYAYEGESKNIVATRHTTLDKVQAEVDYLNDNVKGVEFMTNNSSWKYFNFEELTVTEDGLSNIAFSSATDSSLNVKGLRSQIEGMFDSSYELYFNNPRISNEKTLEKYLTELFRNNLMHGLGFDDVLDIAEELFLSGKIKTDVSQLKNVIANEKEEKKQALNQKIVSVFDGYVSSYKEGKESLFEHLKECYSSEVGTDISFENILVIIDKAYEEGLIKSDFLDWKKDFSEEIMKEKLSSKFPVKMKKVKR